MANKTALVIRATGAQGSGVVHHLLKGGWNVRALVRDPEDARATALKDLGASLHKGNLDDSSSIEAAITGCNAVFLNQMPSAGDGETNEASTVLDLSKKAGVTHIVHASTLTLQDPDAYTKYANNAAAYSFFGKDKVEKLVKGSGLTWTIIRPAFFMTNLVDPIVGFMFPELPDGKLVNCYGEGCTLPLIDTEDIGAFAVAAFEQPDRFNRKTIPLAGEILSIEEIAEHIGASTNKKVEVEYRAENNMPRGLDNPLVAGQVLSRNLSNLVDIGEVKSWGIPLTSFRQFLEQRKSQ